MMRLFFGAMALAAMLTFATGVSVQPLQQTPIMPGFWSWPREKAATPQAIADQCREQVAVQFADGRYFGVRLRANGKPLSPPHVNEVGFCKFDRATQIERCEQRVNYADGGVATGVLESSYSIDGGQLKMNVTPIVGGVRRPAFDVYPIRCPDDSVWSALNGVDSPK